jgi:hypothetical protein
MREINLLGGHMEPPVHHLRLDHVLLIAGVWLLVMGAAGAVFFLR